MRLRGNNDDPKGTSSVGIAPSLISATISSARTGYRLDPEAWKIPCLSGSESLVAGVSARGPGWMTSAGCTKPARILHGSDLVGRGRCQVMPPYGKRMPKRWGTRGGVPGGAGTCRDRALVETGERFTYGMSAFHAFTRSV